MQYSICYDDIETFAQDEYYMEDVSNRFSFQQTYSQYSWLERVFLRIYGVFVAFPYK
jgi:hypothetical protein